MVDNNSLILADFLLERARAELYLGVYGYMSGADKLRGQDLDYIVSDFYPMRDVITIYASFIWMDIPRVVFVEVPGDGEDKHFQAMESFMDDSPVVDAASARKFVAEYLDIFHVG